MSASDFVHLDVAEIFQETEKAFLVQFEDGTEKWVPISQVADAGDYAKGDKNVTMPVTAWWAKQAGIEID